MSNSRRSFLSKAAMAAAMAPFAPLATFGKPMEDAIERTPKSSPPSDLKIESCNTRLYPGQQDVC